MSDGWAIFGSGIGEGEGVLVGSGVAVGVGVGVTVGVGSGVAVLVGVGVGAPVGEVVIQWAPSGWELPCPAQVLEKGSA